MLYYLKERAVLIKRHSLETTCALGRMTEALHPQVSLQNDPNQLKISGAALLGK